MIKAKYRERAKNNKTIIARLVTENDKSYPTIMRWFEENSEMLTTAKSLKIICEELKQSQNEILE